MQEINGNSLPLLLVLGYTQGVQVRYLRVSKQEKVEECTENVKIRMCFSLQVWLIPGSGEAQLVLSWFHGQVPVPTVPRYRTCLGTVGRYSMI